MIPVDNGRAYDICAVGAVGIDRKFRNGKYFNEKRDEMI